MRYVPFTITGLIACALPLGMATSAEAPLAGIAAHSDTPASIEAPIRTTEVAKGLEHPWGLAFLPEGKMLVTERPGRLRIVSADGRLSKPLTGVPEVYAEGQGGLLDVAVSPDFAKDRYVFLTFSEPGDGGAGTAVARGRLGDGGLEQTTVIWRQRPKVKGDNHWGSRLAFRGDGTLFVTLGERQDYRERAQDLTTTLGKLVRINSDGTVPKDNPFVGDPKALPEIWSYGHRNMQAAAISPTGELWTVEHGAKGGDELNHPLPGRNYGWPVVTYGVDYSGLKIGEGQAKEGIEQPVFYWDPVIAPSGAVFYTGDAFPKWRGDLFISSMSPGALVRLRLKDDKVILEERYLQSLKERIRNVRQGPDGFLYLLTDSDKGTILRLSPR